MAPDDTAGIVIEETLSVLMPSFLRRTLSVLFVGVLLISLFVGFAVVDWSEEGAEAQSTGQPPSTDWRPYSVVAPIDTGINVYHDHFRTQEIYPDWLARGPWCDQNMLSDL